MAKKDESSQKADADEKKSEEKDQKEEKSQSPDYDKRIEDLQKTISEQGSTISQLQEYVSGSSVVINTIASNPELKDAFQSALRGQQGVQTQQSQQGSQQKSNSKTDDYQNSQSDKRIDEVYASQREAQIADFEKEVGIDSLKDEEKKDARRKIADYLASFGLQIDTIPLQNLRDNLGKAFVGSIGVERMREEGKAEGVAEMRQNQQGIMGSFSSGSISESQENKLTDAQQKWLQKLRVDPDKAKETYSKRYEEKDREKGSGDKK